MRNRIQMAARLGVVAVFLVLGILISGVVGGVQTPAFAGSPSLEGLVAKIEGNTLYLVLNYGPLQAVDISTLSADDRAKLVPSEWAEIDIQRDGDLIQAVRVTYSGECIEDAHRACHDPGVIHGTQNAAAVIAEALGQPLPPLPPAGATTAPPPTIVNENTNGNGNSSNGNGNSSSSNGNDNSSSNGNGNSSSSNGNGNSSNGNDNSSSNGNGNSSNGNGNS